MNGVEATRAIRSRWPSVIVIGLSVQEDEATATSMLEAGAHNFLPISGDPAEFLRAIVAVTAKVAQQ